MGSAPCTGLAATSAAASSTASPRPTARRTWRSPRSTARLFIPRAVFREIGGFDESYGSLHGYDRDLSFAVRAIGRRCVVVRSRFIHRGGGTRIGPNGAGRGDGSRTRRDMIRAEVGARAAVDVRSARERLADRLRLLRMA